MLNSVQDRSETLAVLDQVDSLSYLYLTWKRMAGLCASKADTQLTFTADMLNLLAWILCGAEGRPAKERCMMLS